MFFSNEAILQTAIETPTTAFPPKFDLLSVPSRFIINSSIFFWFSQFKPTTFLEIALFTLLTAFKTPFPLYLDLSPSLNSKASWLPVDAPLGTIALAFAFSVKTLTLIGGFPLESKTFLASFFLILDKIPPNQKRK